MVWGSTSRAPATSHRPSPSASESQAYAFAVKGFAERINGVVNSHTTVDIKGNNGVESRVTQTIVKHSTKNTSITEHVEVKKYNYELASSGRVHSYVRIKMPLQVFDKLRRKIWFIAPLGSSLIGSTIDTFLFFSIAFYSTGIPWVSLAFGDLFVKLFIALSMLIPFRLLLSSIRDFSELRR